MRARLPNRRQGVQIAISMMLAERLVDEIPIWTVFGANLLAAVVMLGILFRAHHRMPSEVLTVGE